MLYSLRESSRYDRAYTFQNNPTIVHKSEHMYISHKAE